MKIQPVMETIRSTEAVREKKDGQRRHQQHQDQQQKNDKNNLTFQVTDDKVESAMNEFQSDAQALAAGLSAAKEGSGPGLRIILKDGSGVVIRQFTGEEFVQMRDAVNGKSASGKILDRKY